MGYQDPDVCWEDVPWVQSMTNLPLVLKGIQCVEDAEKAFQYGVQGIVLSNHGGRSLDLYVYSLSFYWSTDRSY